MHNSTKYFYHNIAIATTAAMFINLLMLNLIQFGPRFGLNIHAWLQHAGMQAAGLQNIRLEPIMPEHNRFDFGALLKSIILRI